MFCLSLPVYHVCATSGQAQASLALVKEQKCRGLVVDVIALNTTLLACASAGLYSACFEIFREMRQAPRGPKPNLVTYNTLCSTIARMSTSSSPVPSRVSFFGKNEGQLHTTKTADPLELVFDLLDDMTSTTSESPCIEPDLATLTSAMSVCMSAQGSERGRVAALVILDMATGANAPAKDAEVGFYLTAIRFFGVPARHAECIDAREVLRLVDKLLAMDK